MSIFPVSRMATFCLRFIFHPLLSIVSNPTHVFFEVSVWYSETQARNALHTIRNR